MRRHTIVRKKALFKSIAYILLAIFLLSHVLCLPSGFAEVCDFSPLAEELPLLAQYATEVTTKAADDKEFWQMLQKAVPNVQRVYASKSPNFVALLGWGTSWDDFAKYTKDQIQNRFIQIAEAAKSKLNKQGQNYRYSFSEGTPLTMYVTITYLDEGHPFQDIAIDIVATPQCVASLKVSARTDDLTSEQWQTVRDQFELLRRMILTRYGNIQFSAEGSRVWWGDLTNRLIWTLGTLFFAWIASIGFCAKFSLVPGRTNKKVFPLYDRTVFGNAYRNNIHI